MKKLAIFITILAVFIMACGFSVDLPKRPTPGAEVTDQITVPSLKSDETRLNLSFGAGSMKLSGGAKNLVDGTATYNVADFKPTVSVNENVAEIKMSNIENFDFLATGEIVNNWDFKLGDSPMDLNIQAGAYEGDFQFGGLALTSLTIQDGAADVELSFSEVNPSEMSILRYETGASSVRMNGLANANFALLDFSSGAGDYILDFSGDLQREATIKIESGFSNITLIIPENINAEITIESGASNVTTGSGWSQSGNIYTQKGDSPKLIFVVELGAGNITLTK